MTEVECAVSETAAGTGAAIQNGPQLPKRRHPRLAPSSSFPKVIRRSIRSEVRMVPAVISVEGRPLRFAVSDNENAVGPDGIGSPPVWAINVHGFFAGGGMYWRESAWLAETLGWRIITPSLPGFGGSGPLPSGQVSMRAMADQICVISDHVGAGPSVLLGHSMGGAVAVRYAVDHPGRTLGVIYRDGIATPAWKHRRGLVPALLAPIAPDIGALYDILFSLCIDGPDLFVGRMSSTVRSMLPDVRRNVRAMSATLPVGAMLMEMDLSDLVRSIAERGDIPLLPIWGILDRLTGRETAGEFEELAGSKMQWVPGGHSWMLGRPQRQAEVLRYLDTGLHFLDQIEMRWRVLNGRLLSSPTVIPATTGSTGRSRVRAMHIVG
ncbi:MAG: alpha/beta fold hydrolase [Acidimicrobiales bacterium]